MSPNKRERLHWTGRHKTNKRWRGDIMKALTRDRFCIVRITVHRKRLLDEDNAFGALKPVLDGLRDSGLIYDDSARWIVLRSEQILNDIEFTDIEIREVPG
jgi:hypothetical protein